MARILIVNNGDSLQVNNHFNAGIDFMRQAAPQHKWVIANGSRNGGRSLAFGRSMALYHGNRQPLPDDFEIILLYIMLKTNTPYNSEGVGGTAQDMINIQEIIRNHSCRWDFTHIIASTVFVTGSGGTTAPDLGRSGDNASFNAALRTQMPTWNTTGLSGLPKNAVYQVLDPAKVIMPNDNSTPTRSRLDPDFPTENMSASNTTIFGNRSVFADFLHQTDFPYSRTNNWANPGATEFLGAYGTDWQLLPWVRYLCQLVGLANPPLLFGVPVF
jgi:hypothetical protein